MLKASHVGKAYSANSFCIVSSVNGIPASNGNACGLKQPLQPPVAPETPTSSDAMKHHSRCRLVRGSCSSFSKNKPFKKLAHSWLLGRCLDSEALLPDFLLLPECYLNAITSGNTRMTVFYHARPSFKRLLETCYLST